MLGCISRPALSEASGKVRRVEMVGMLSCSCYRELGGRMILLVISLAKNAILGCNHERKITCGAMGHPISIGCPLCLHPPPHF